jgi:hypothetical protein
VRALLLLLGLLALGMIPRSGPFTAPRAISLSDTEARALAFLEREVPRWKPAHRCFSCHNNGDAARALYSAVGLGVPLESEVLADTNRWLSRPEGWDHNHGDERFNDKVLSDLQFAQALVAAQETGEVSSAAPLRRAADRLARHQKPAGYWRIEPESQPGSPVTYGNRLATFLAMQMLRRVAPAHDEEIVRAEKWLHEQPVRTIGDAAVVLLDLREEPERVARARELLRQGEDRDGGWGPYVNAGPEVFDTALVLLALARRRLPGTEEMVQRGRAYLVATQQEEGDWPETTRPPGAVSYAQRLSTTGWATLALLATR